MLAEVEYAIAATSERAIRATHDIGSICVTSGIIALLTEINATVTAGDTEEPACLWIAAVRECHPMNARFADFVESLLDDAIAAGAALEETFCGATILISAIVVVAFLRMRTKTVATEREGGNVSLNAARSRTPVAGDAVPVIALLGSHRHAIATVRSTCKHRRFQRAIFPATVAGVGVGVIAFLRSRKNAVATVGCGCDHAVLNGAGLRAAVTTGDIAVVALLATVLNRISADRECTIRAASVRHGVGIVLTVIALLSGIQDAITAQGKTFAVFVARICPWSLHDQTSVFRALRVCIESTRKRGITLVGTRSGYFHASCSLALRVRVFGIAPEERIACIVSSSRHHRAGTLLAFGVLRAIDVVVAGIHPWTGNGHAGVIFTLHVRLLPASKEGIAVLWTGTGENNTGIGDAFRMFVAIDERVACIISRSIFRKAFACGAADGVLQSAVIVLRAGIVSITGYEDTGIILADRMPGGITAEVGIALEFSGTEKD
ncbi:hypothetical protein A3C37_00110 [Candidatus Peribacteria bacterium RIFCSPHIGHO2_02_FULL_53_20]|nr:MAG: hypothetical protein A3C37_00110 [Candidatus Peribacteria bacterium RIFCSPHIGHO2_02_FULL_53_20]